MKKSPTLARKFENGKFKVVLKAKEWLSGVMMLREPPFLFASSWAREMQSTKTNQPETDTETKRVERYQQWKSKGAPDEHILLQELICKKGDFMKAKRCLLETFSFQHDFSKDASEATVEHFLKQKMLETNGVFSSISFGSGFFPILSHMRVTEKESEANTCIWYENSNAYVYPLQTLYQNNEIVIYHGKPLRDKQTLVYLDCAYQNSISFTKPVCLELELEQKIKQLKTEAHTNKHMVMDIIRLEMLFLSQKLAKETDQRNIHKWIQSTLGAHSIGIADFFRCIQNDLFAKEWISLWFKKTNGFYHVWSHVTDVIVEPLFSLASLAWDEEESK